MDDIEKEKHLKTADFALELANFIEPMNLDLGVLLSGLNLVLASMAHQQGILKDQYMKACSSVWDSYLHMQTLIEKRGDSLESPPPSN